MEIYTANNSVLITSTIKVKDKVMVVIGDEFDQDNWQYGETFKVKKIVTEPYGTFAYKNKKENINITKIISLERQ